MKRVVQSIGFLIVSGMACSSDPLAFDIGVPSALSANAKWIEIGAFRGSSCSTLSTSLTGGIPEGYTKRYAFNRTDTASPQPSFGDLPNDKYAFAAVARDDTCAVIAAGCTDVDVGDASSISISLVAINSPTGECGAGSTCQAAKCVPANDNADPSVGASCSLELLGAGPLANTSGVDGTLVSAPAIAATSSGGFIIVYREIDGATAGGARLVVLPVDSSGGALRPERRGLKDRCSGSSETDGVGIVVNDNDGLAVFAKAPCPAAEHPEPSLQVATFEVESSDDPQRPKVTGLFDSPSPDTANRITLGAAKPSTQKKSANIVVFTQNGTGNIATLDPKSGAKGPNGQFGGTGVTDTWVTASDKVLALLSVGAGDPGVEPGPIEGDGGADAGAIIGSDSDTTLRLLMLDPKIDVQTIKNDTTRPITFAGKFGALAATGGRVVVITGNEGIGRSVTYHAFDFGKEEEADSSGFTVDQPSSTSKSKVTAGDVTIHGNRAYMVGLQEGQIGLQVYDNATTQLTPLRSVMFSRQTRISGISTVRDGSVSVAASDNRVGVVWTTAKTLGSNDAAGGYAVFACTQ